MRLVIQVTLAGLGHVHWPARHHWGGHRPSVRHGHHLGVGLAGPRHGGPWHGGLPVHHGWHHGGGRLVEPEVHVPERGGDGEHVVVEDKLELVPLGVLRQRADLLVDEGAPPGGEGSRRLREGGVPELHDDVTVLQDDVHLGPVHWRESDVDADLLLVHGEGWEELLHAEEWHGVLDRNLNDEEVAADVADKLLGLDVGWHVKALLELLAPHVLLALLDLFLAPDEQLVVRLELDLDVLERAGEATDVNDDAPLLKTLLERATRHRWHGTEPLGLVEPLDPRRRHGLEEREVELIEGVKPHGGPWHGRHRAAEERVTRHEGERNDRHFEVELRVEL